MTTPSHCHAPTCWQSITPDGPHYEVRCVVVFHNGVSREAAASRIVCSALCAVDTMSELLKAVSVEAVAESANECHAIRGGD